MGCTIIFGKVSARINEQDLGLRTWMRTMVDSIISMQRLGTLAGQDLDCMSDGQLELRVQTPFNLVIPENIGLVGHQNPLTHPK